MFKITTRSTLCGQLSNARIRAFFAPACALLPATPAQRRFFAASGSDQSRFYRCAGEHRHARGLRPDRELRGLATGHAGPRQAWHVGFICCRCGPRPKSGFSDGRRAIEFAARPQHTSWAYHKNPAGQRQDGPKRWGRMDYTPGDVGSIDQRGPI